jgi:hypothetical protein
MKCIIAKLLLYFSAAVHFRFHESLLNETRSPVSTYSPSEFSQSVKKISLPRM